MGMTILATAAVAALAGGTQAIMANQQAQHAKGAAQAQETAMNAQVADQKKIDAADLTKKADSASATRAAAMNAIKASMSTTGQMGGTILTGGGGAAPAPTANKTLLGV